MSIGETNYSSKRANLSEDHRKYRIARQMLGIAEHDVFFQLASKQAGNPVSAEQARIDSVAMDHGVKRGVAGVKTFTAPHYVMYFVDKILRGEIDPVTREPKRASAIIDNFPSTLARSDKERRRESSVRPGTRVAHRMHEPDASRSI